MIPEPQEGSTDDFSQDSPEQIPWQTPGVALEFSTGQASYEIFLLKKSGRPNVGSSQ